MDYYQIKIEVNGRETRLFLDGVEVRNWREFQFNANARALPELTLTTLPDIGRKTVTPDDKDGDGYPEGALS